MKGKFYVVGVGPGEPELITLKAIRIIKESHVVALPISRKGFEKPIYEAAGEARGDAKLLEGCMAYQIVRQVLPEVSGKAKLYLPMPMLKEKDRLDAAHSLCADAAAGRLDAGDTAAFLTIGDPSVYSTGMYVHERLKRKGYETHLVPGVPSFCAAAAALDTEIARNKEEIHILPASYGVEKGLYLPGTKILMKAGKKMPEIKRMAREKGIRIQMAENCGMEDERYYFSAEEIPDKASYYSLLMIKEEA
ncbi:MAG: precorrin-2 C(20)-methyltransferase [Coprococcus sp.]|nr:precorrin-2 C(20)-methyltransferase [Coprococcus sp.]